MSTVVGYGKCTVAYRDYCFLARCDFLLFLKIKPCYHRSTLELPAYGLSLKLPVTRKEGAIYLKNAKLCQHMSHNTSVSHLLIITTVIPLPHLVPRLPYPPFAAQHTTPPDGYGTPRSRRSTWTSSVAWGGTGTGRVRSTIKVQRSNYDQLMRLCSIISLQLHSFCQD